MFHASGSPIHQPALLSAHGREFGAEDFCKALAGRKGGHKFAVTKAQVRFAQAAWRNVIRPFLIRARSSISSVILPKYRFEG
ncbi:hypothetical protein [Agrobacterium sp. NPDC090283]|uniref:hypothetical protein n=1 Tax=Agrobacterium sp. NPDC090283 TaxID=3363920 RepID=UPI00383BF2E4